MDNIQLTGNLTIMKFDFSVVKGLQLHILTGASLGLKSNLLLAIQTVDKVYFLVKTNNAQQIKLPTTSVWRYVGGLKRNSQLQNSWHLWFQA